MDISLPLDHIQSSYRFACSLIIPTIYKQKAPGVDVFSLRKIRRRSPFSRIRCSLLDQGLRPRPMPKPLKRDENNVKKDGILEETHLENPNCTAGICAQIEKLVLCKSYHEALELFEILECDGGFGVTTETYDALVSACIGLRSIRGVKRVFDHMLHSKVDLDLNMMNRGLLMHVKCRMMIDARQLFDDMPEKNMVSWNTILGGLVGSGNFIEAFRLFLMMWDDDSDIDSRTFATMIRASSGLELISPGKQLHSCALKMGLSDDVFVFCTLIDMYSKCGNIEDARFVFDAMPEKTTVGWNSIIAGYALHGYSEEALSMYYEMQDSGAKMDHFTYSIIVRVCTRLASLEHAKQAHAGLVRNGFGSDMVIMVVELRQSDCSSAWFVKGWCLIMSLF
ncbi:hypothetical protein OROGR_009438 [Orobanche gracilis]